MLSERPSMEPLTLLRCLAEAARRPAGAPTWVQVRRRLGGAPVVLCGRVARLDEGDDGRDWFKVDTAIGIVWCESANVRLCSGDGRCACEVAEC